MMVSIYSRNVDGMSRGKTPAVRGESFEIATHGHRIGISLSQTVTYGTGARGGYPISIERIAEVWLSKNDIKRLLAAFPVDDLLYPIHADAMNGVLKNVREAQTTLESVADALAHVVDNKST
jgi:hypothetical protein